MPFTIGLGALLGGLTEETSKIKAERFQQEQANLKVSTDMLQHIVDNPNIYDPNIKAQAQEGLRDVIFEHLFPDQFKGSKANPVKKMVDQFVGQQQTGPAMVQAMQQAGVGRGNAKTQVGAPSAPQQPSTPLPPPMSGSSPQGQPSGSPPAPPWQQAGSAGSTIPTVGGFASPLDVQGAQLQQQSDIENKGKMQFQQQTAQNLQQTLKGMGLSDQQVAQAVSGAFGSSMSLMPIAPMNTIDDYNSATGETKEIPVEWNGSGWIQHPEKARIKPPAEKQQEFNRLASVYANDTSKDNPFRGMGQAQIAGKLFEREDMALIQDRKAQEALRYAQAKYYNEVKDDPYANMQGKMAFDALNNAQTMAQMTWKEMNSNPTYMGLDKDNKPVMKYRTAEELDYNHIFDKLMETNAASIGWTVDQLKQFALTGKPPKLSELPNRLGLTPPGATAPAPGAPASTPTSSGGTRQKGFLDLLKDVYDRDIAPSVHSLGSVINLSPEEKKRMEAQDPRNK